MLVSQTAEYALRAMAWLSLLPEGASATCHDVSKATGIPENYAAKVLRRMVGAGLLEAQKGHHGGFHLARAPGQIRFLDIFDAVEEDVVGDRCAFGRARCNSKNPCPLHESALAVRTQVAAWAESTTLASLPVTAFPVKRTKNQKS